MSSAPKEIRAADSSHADMEDQKQLQDSEEKPVEELVLSADESEPEAGPSRRRTQSISSPSQQDQIDYPPLDEGEDGESELSTQFLHSQRTPRRVNSQRNSTASSSHRRRSIPIEISTLPKRAIERTIDTTTASWSPDKKGKSKEVSPPSPQRSSRDARVNLRERLKGFASQGGEVVLQDIDDVTMEDQATLNLSDSHSSKPALGADIEQTDKQVVGVDEEGRQEDSMEMHSEPGDRDLASTVRESAITNERNGEDMPEEEVISDRPSSRQQSSPSVGADPPDKLDISPQMATPVTRHRLSSSSYRDEVQSVNPTVELTLSFDLPRLKRRYANKAADSASLPSARTHDRHAFASMKEGSTNSAAGILNRDATTAEEALSRVIQKSDFEKMEVLGQFNKGFIIARLRDGESGGEEGNRKDDLFIIDQHASDEKFNFETLQRTTVIKAQTLIK
jgi:DNA mismatch repair protein PMS2